jgi:hypothetical protein
MDHWSVDSIALLGINSCFTQPSIVLSS